MKLLVAGVGNIFLGDDAFGVDVVRRLEQRPLPQGVCVTDFGIRSYDLAYALMDDWDLVILVDTVGRGGAPGTLYTIELELPDDAETSTAFDAHTMDPVAVLQLVRLLGGQPARLLLIGCEPAKVEPYEEGNFGLSAPVGAAVDEAVRMIEELIARRTPATAA